MEPLTSIGWRSFDEPAESWIADRPRLTPMGRSMPNTSAHWRELRTRRRKWARKRRNSFIAVHEGCWTTFVPPRGRTESQNPKSYHSMDVAGCFWGTVGQRSLRSLHCSPVSNSQCIPCRERWPGVGAAHSDPDVLFLPSLTYLGNRAVLEISGA